MKGVWITCSVLCVCGLICSGILGLMGHSLLKATSEAKAAADEYALTTVTAVCRTWDENELKHRLDPAAQPDLAGAVVAAGKPLGGLRTAGPFYATAIAVTPEGGVKITRVTATDVATFERGEAQITLVVVHVGDGWKVRDFQIVPTRKPRGVTA